MTDRRFFRGPHNDDDSVQVETICYQLAPAKCKPHLVWKSHKIKEFQQECRDMVDVHKTNGDYVACIHHLFACKQSAPATSGNEADDDGGNVPQNPSVPQDTTDIRMVSKSPARGLEAGVAPIIRTHRASRSYWLLRPSSTSARLPTKKNGRRCFGREACKSASDHGYLLTSWRRGMRQKL
jgi:hypothetical protein